MRMPTGMGLCFFVCLICLFAKSAAKCPTSFPPSQVLPGVTYNYTHGPLAERISQLQAKLAARFKTNRPEAYAISVIHRNTTILTAGSVDTPFRIGSVTKVFTAMGAMMLRERGVLRLDDPVKKFLPKFSVINPYDNHQPTLRELMSHTSGLPRDLCPGLLNCGSTSNEKEILERIAKMELAIPPWSLDLPLYSNLGFAILAHAWEKATSPPQSWSDFISDHIFAPLGMHSSGDDLAHVQLAPGNVAPGYASNYSLDWAGPAGDLYSTALDLAKFLKFMVKPNKDLLSPSSIREWTQSATFFPDKAQTPFGTIPPFGFGFAMPWELFSVTASGTALPTPLVTKNGGIGTYISYVAFHPATELGAVVLISDSNPQLANGNTSLAFDVISEIFDELIPEVSSTNSKILSSLYSGTYSCERTNPVLVQNITLQVVGGNVTVNTTTPGYGLIAAMDISLLVDGVLVPQVFSSSLVLHIPNENIFWAYPTVSCLFLGDEISSSQISSSRPNYPGSFDFYEVQFDPSKGLLRWPAVGAVCHRS